LKRYKDVVELASLVVAEEYRGQGIGPVVIGRLLKRQKGPIYLVCEPNRVGFFQRCGFHFAWPPKEMLPKLEWYIGQGVGIYVMRWPDGV
jgi:N-acetylglutamate synthase-like GNAT family acetyltransferase